MEKGSGGSSRRGLRVIAGRQVREHEYAEPVGPVDITEDDDLGLFRGVAFAALFSIILALVVYFSGVLIFSLELVK